MRTAGCLLVLLAACAGATPEAPPAPAPSTGWTPAERVQLSKMRMVDWLPKDPTNAWADDPKAVVLGRALFYDKALSPDGRFSCASCHDPARHFTDGRPVAVGAGVAARHTPTIEGAQRGPWFFWDGRADSLWAQAAGPVENPVEMASDRTHVARTVGARHADAYAAVFGPPPDLSDTTRFPPNARPDADAAAPVAVAWTGMSEADRGLVTGVFVNAMKAIAAFERTALPSDAPFDAYVDALMAGDAAGGGHLDDAAVRGLRTFLRDGNCVACHHGPMLTDGAFHNLGTAEPRGGFDPGRSVGASLVKSGEFNCESGWADAHDCPELRYLNPEFLDFPSAFKTPTLRNVTATAPYMHHGGFADLDAVLEFYSTLPTQPVVGHRELTLQPLHLTPAQKGDLEAFLKALEAPVRPEALEPSGS